MKNYSFLLLLLFMLSCSDSIIKNNEKKFQFYNNEKLWAHRTNNPNEANERLKEFKGIELDVFYVGNNKIEVRHDPKKDKLNSFITLDEYFAKIKNIEKYYYWIDFKNISKQNIDEVTLRLKQLFDKYKIKQNCIIESPNVFSLSKLLKENFFTSYWIPHFSYDKQNLKDFKDKADLINYYIGENKFHFFSCHYKMVDFVRHYFPKAKINIWTNGLITEEDKQVIKKLVEIDNIKVILVDYEKNFLRK